MLGKEAGRVSFVGGRIKKVLKGGKTAAKAIVGTKAAKKGAKAVKASTKSKIKLPKYKAEDIGKIKRVKNVKVGDVKAQRVLVGKPGVFQRV